MGRNVYAYVSCKRSSKHYVEGLDAVEHASEVRAQLGVGENEEADAAVAVAEAVVEERERW